VIVEPEVLEAHPLHQRRTGMSRSAR
jgi:hypothetical protein